MQTTQDGSLQRISPTCYPGDTVECERGFSCMNYIKHELYSTLTQTNLNAAIAIGLDKLLV